VLHTLFESAETEKKEWWYSTRLYHVPSQNNDTELDFACFFLINKPTTENCKHGVEEVRQ